MNDNKVLAIFRRLAKQNCWLRVQKPVQEDPQQHICAVLISEGAICLKTPHISLRLVREWLSDGRIEPSAEGYRISQAGVNWVRRRLSAGDEFQAQHQERRIRVIDVEGSRRPAVVNDSESPLRWLANRKDKNGVPLLAPYQVEAGERLRMDYQFAGLTARVTASWSPAAQSSSNSGANDATGMQDNVLAARQRVVRALAAVGPELCGVLVDVCCHLKGIEEAEKTEGWPQRSGKVVLQIALTSLARHYGLVSDRALHKSGRRASLHWGADDFRPEIRSGRSGS